jgi:hypothetical protein
VRLTEMSDTNVARLTIGDISVVSGERGIHCKHAAGRTDRVNQAHFAEGDWGCERRRSLERSIDLAVPDLFLRTLF